MTGKFHKREEKTTKKYAASIVDVGNLHFLSYLEIEKN